MTRTERVYINDHPTTRLFHLDDLGHEVPLLSEAGRPVNFERDPVGLNRSIVAMATADRLWGEQ